MNLLKRSAIAVSGKKFRTKNISKRIQKIVISPIKEMSILADQLEEKINLRKYEKNKTRENDEIISFGQGIPYWDTPDYIKKEIKKSLKDLSTSQYTLEPGITELRNLIAEDLKKSKGVKNIEPKKEIMVSSGCQEAVDCALLSVIDDCDEVLLLEPAFASHIEQTIQLGGIPKFVPMIESGATGQGWRLDIKECEKNLTSKTKAIIFSNPSNPTGTVFTKEEIIKLAKFAKKHNLIIISDETYDFLTYDGVKYFSPANLPWIKNNLILCGSFSKKFAMTGYRVGFAYSEEGIIDHMLKAHDALSICAPSISQKAAIAALKNKKESDKSVSEAIKKFSYNRTLMMSELDKLKDFLEYQKPTGAYYILAKIKKQNVDSFKLAIKILNKAKVIVIPGDAFGPSGKNHIRFSFAGEPENIRKGFKRLKNWFEFWRKNSYKL